MPLKRAGTAARLRVLLAEARNLRIQLADLRCHASTRSIGIVDLASVHACLLSRLGFACPHGVQLTCEPAHLALRLTKLVLHAEELVRKLCIRDIRLLERSLVLCCLVPSCLHSSHQIRQLLLA